LERFKLDFEIVDVRRDRIGGDNIRGIIIDFNDEYLLLNSLNDVYCPNGITVLRADDITQIKWGMIRDVFHADSIKNFVTGKIDYSCVMISSIRDIMTSIFCKTKVCTVYCESLDNNICYPVSGSGFMHDGIVILNYINTDGYRDGNIAISVDDITRIDAFDEYSNYIARLYSPIE
jgi:methionine aminopeptidase